MDPGTACEFRRWDLRWSSYRGHEPCEGCAEMDPRTACEFRHWDLRWSSLWGTKRVRGVPKERHAESKGKDEEEGGGGGGQREEGVNAGRCLFKTRTQHHRMVGKK